MGAASKLTRVIGPFEEAYPGCWTWNNDDKSPAVQLCSRKTSAYFHIDPVYTSEGTAAVRGSQGFSNGAHYWEIDLCEPTYGTSVMIGVGTKKAKIHTGDYQYVDILGIDGESWGLNYKGYLYHNGTPMKFTDCFYAGTTIGVLLDMDVGKLSYYKNGSFLGTAFTDLLDRQCELYPMISSTATEGEMQLGVRGSKVTTLEDLCKSTVHRYFDLEKIDSLGLPPSIVRKLNCYDPSAENVM